MMKPGWSATSDRRRCRHETDGPLLTVFTISITGRPIASAITVKDEVIHFYSNANALSCLDPSLLVDYLHLNNRNNT